MNSFFWILVISAFSAFAYSVDGLSCYHCNSNEDKQCGDPFDITVAAKYLKDCSKIANATGSNHFYCRKTIQKTSLRGRKEEDVRVIRTCGHKEDTRFILDKEDAANSMKCYKKTGTFDVEMLYCGCHQSECNSASALAPTLTIITLITLALVSSLFDS